MLISYTGHMVPKIRVVGLDEFLTDLLVDIEDLTKTGFYSQSSQYVCSPLKHELETRLRG